MFDFFKKKKESVFVDPCGDLLKEVQILKTRLPDFDPYNMKKLQKTLATEEKIMEKYETFFTNYGPDDMSIKEYKLAKESFELDQERFDWDQSLLLLMQKILELAQDGIMQSDIKKHLPDANPKQITEVCKRFEKEKRIKREKKGSSYYITI